MPGDETLVEMLQLARDVCICLAAFIVPATERIAPATEGVLLSMSEASRVADAEVRIAALARGCRSHPSSQGRELFWNAEVSETGDESWGSEREPLACVALPLWSGGTWLGVLGVVDIFLPELDEEQRSGLRSIGSAVASRALDLAVDGGAGRQVEMLASSLERPEVRSFFADIADGLPEGLIVARQDGTVSYVNEALVAMSGLAAGDMVGTDIRTLLAPDSGQGMEARADQIDALVGSSQPGRRLRLRSAQASLPVDVCGALTSVEPLGDSFVVLLRNASQVAGGGSVWEAPVAASARAVMEGVMDALHLGVVVCDADGTVALANSLARELQGIPSEEELLGRPFPQTTGLCASDGIPLSRVHHPLTRALRGTVVENERLVLGSEGRSILASARPLEVAGFGGALLVLRDVTTQLEEEARLTQMALHDPLTGLANRNLLLDYLRRNLADYRNRAGAVALVFLDLDDFKEVNDRYGHDVGDEILVAVARRVRGAVRSSDIVARLGGDELVVAHAATDDPRDVEQIVDRIGKTLSAPFRVRGRNIVVTASIGSVQADPWDEDPGSLLVRADREMYRRKRAHEEMQRL